MMTTTNNDDRARNFMKYGYAANIGLGPYDDDEGVGDCIDGYDWRGHRIRQLCMHDLGAVPSYTDDELFAFNMTKPEGLDYDDLNKLTTKTLCTLAEMVTAKARSN